MTDDLIGKIITGEVVSIKPFGAFIKLENGEQGLVHISEITNDYVKDINDYIQEGQSVKVKVLGMKDQNKFTLSIKQVEGQAESESKPRQVSKPVSKAPKNDGFEDKLTYFLKRSEEKQIDIRRNMKSKQGITKRRK